MCRAPDCGGEGQWACCLFERISSCDDGLIEDLSPAGPNTDCEDVLGVGNCGCGVGGGTSLGICRAKKAVGDPGCDNLFDPCQEGATCLAIDFGETICVPDQSDRLFGDAVCAAFCNPTAHANAINAVITQTYGIGGSVSFATICSVEAGIAYAADGCYYTKCYGFDPDISFSGSACIGQIFDGLWDSVAGDSCAVSVGVSVPGTDVGGSVTSGWAGDGLEDCFSAPEPESSAQCFSVGLA